MPSSLPAVRPALAALLTALLVAASVLFGGMALPLPAASAASADVPAAPPAPSADAPVSMDLVSLTPTSLAPGGTLEATVEVTNTSSAPLSDVALELRTRDSRVTDRAVLSSWQADTAPDAEGAALTTSPSHPTLAPGESATLTVRLDAEELGYSPEAYYWGTRRISLTVTAGDEGLASLRSFVVWRPSGTDTTITQSVLLPVSDPDPAAAVLAPEEQAASLDQGRLAQLGQLAARADVDWWLDPALLDPPAVAEDPAGGPDADESASTVLTYAASPQATALADALDGAVGERTVLAMPYAGADTVSLEAAGTETLQGAVRDAGDRVWEEHGISPRSTTLRIDGQEADAEALEDALDAGATSVIVPSSSLRADPSAGITPSSIGVYESTRTEGAQLALLAPDPVLSDEFSLLTAGSDTEQTRQRLLAETATIASEFTEAPRHLLIAPSADAALDPAAAGAVLDAFSEAPWIETGPTSRLLDAAEHGDLTTNPSATGEDLLALGTVAADSVVPSGPADGTWRHLEAVRARTLLDPDALTALQGTWEHLDVLAEVMEDRAPLEGPRLEVLGATSQRWRGDAEATATRAADAAERTAALRERIQVLPASGYNVISDSAAVPITITNDLDTPITVQVVVASDKPLVQVGEPQTVEVPARGQVDASVSVEAVANGRVTLTTTLATQDGRELSEPVDVPLTVNPSWENWTTLVLVIAMGLLVVVGVARARRTGSSTRAPAMLGPEDPEVLARTGRSTPDTGPSAKVWAARRAEQPGTPEPLDSPDSPDNPDRTDPEEDPR